MVSYLVPRGRSLIKKCNLRQFVKQQSKWPTRWTFRQSSTSSSAVQNKVNNIIENDTSSLVKKSLNDNHNGNQTEDAHFKKGSQRRWISWKKFLLGWAPVGFCVFGAIEWKLHKNKMIKEDCQFTASQFQTKVYCSLPLRIISRLWGWLAGCYIPVSLRPYIFGWYSDVFKVNIEEAFHSDFKHYRNLSEFFTRELKVGVRHINQKAPLISPADGKVLHFGAATDSLIEQVKGVNYDIQTFLGPSTWISDANEKISNYALRIKEKKDGSTSLYQCVIYLAPGDYHRFHSPTAWVPKIRRHFTGKLLSVSPKIAAWLPGLFCLNERVLYIGKWNHGFFSFTAVGATNVGSVQIYVDEKLKTNCWLGLNIGANKPKINYDELLVDESTKFTKGECIGQFNMGSTIVLIFEAPTDFKFTIKHGQTIRMGESLGSAEK